MDKNLANYIFHNETIYLDTVASVSIEEKSKPAVQKTTPAKLKTTTPQDVVLIPRQYQMKTNHLIVVHGLSEDEKDFLVKVLLALDMSLAKTDLLDIQQNGSEDFKAIIYNNAVKTILFFGEAAGGDFLPKLKLTPFVIKEIKNIRFLFSSNLSQVSQNQSNEKRLLWEALKQFYA